MDGKFRLPNTSLLVGVFGVFCHRLSDYKLHRELPKLEGRQQKSGGFAEEQVAWRGKNKGPSHKRSTACLQRMSCSGFENRVTYIE